MSALGQKQTSAHLRVMSALPPKADIGHRAGDQWPSGAAARRRPRRLAMPSSQTRMAEYFLERVRRARADWNRTARAITKSHTRNRIVFHMHQCTDGLRLYHQAVPS